MICRGKCLLGEHHFQTPGFQTEKSHRAGYFMDEMTIDKQYIRPIRDLPDNMGIPYFVK